MAVLLGSFPMNAHSEHLTMTSVEYSILFSKHKLHFHLAWDYEKLIKRKVFEISKNRE